MKSITEQLIIMVFILDLIVGVVFTGVGIRLTFTDPKPGWFAISAGQLLLWSCWAIWNSHDIGKKESDGSK